MAHFFFHVRDDEGGFSRDDEGQELPDLEAAKREALNSNREILGEQLLHGSEVPAREIEIADQAGTVLAVVNVREALFQKNHLRAFADDVTQSAPKMSVKAEPR
jgi:hypothetical protein